ncbi:MAG: ATP-dependent Clp protease proteolytic subunit [Bdellovibrionales bacterium]|nr:ATP-dependent Clp protease proteolytic subunit [Bdellovibrionales bacterium]
MIAYYSGWLQKPGIGGVEIDDNDKNALMAVVHKLDRTKGLDLILHTPGGQVAATESLVDYLRKMFGSDIEVFVPQIAMSAGTMISCSAKKIFMGKQSNLGPIDPQFSGIPAFGVIEEFNRAVQEIQADPSKIPIWQVIISKYHPTFIGECQNAIVWSQQIVTDWLETGMFAGQQNPKQLAQAVVNHLTDRANMRTHSRHISAEKSKTYGLVIEDLESDNVLQDLVLTVHHCFMHTFSNSHAIKIVENHDGVAIVNQVQVVQKRR